MTNGTSIGVTFEGTWCNRVITQQEDSHPTAPVDKHMNE